jgi:hypothetical protein
MGSACSNRGGKAPHSPVSWWRACIISSESHSRRAAFDVAELNHQLHESTNEKRINRAGSINGELWYSLQTVVDDPVILRSALVPFLQI